MVERREFVRLGLPGWRLGGGGGGGEFLGEAPRSPSKNLRENIINLRKNVLIILDYE